MKKRGIINMVLAGVMLTSVAVLITACNSGEDNPPQNKEYSNEVQVVVLLGQSNAEGHTWSQYLTKTVGVEKAQEYATGYDNVKISYACTIADNTSNGQFTTVKLGQGHSLNQFGPEVGIAEKISALDPKKQVYIIKYAYGATSLTTQWRSPSSKNTGALYTNAVNYIKEQCQKLEDMDLYPIIKAVCWMQGEDDSSGLNYNSYEQLERNFVADLREDLSYYKPADAEIGFIDAGISDCPAWTQQAVVNAAKKKLAEEDDSHVFIDTIAAELRYNGEPAGAPDIYHFDSSSEIKLGHLFAQELIAGFLETN
jgi:hypothetical protein